MNNKDYYLGLDIGTNSVGWAVTDEEYNLLKFKRKDMWGIRLFENAKTAADRRMHRSARRRYQRQKWRIDILQELFAAEIHKVDPTFFIRLNESRLHLEDKSTGVKYPIFADPDYTDIQYYKDYPTIFHLRNFLVNGKCEDGQKVVKKQDVRLVYLALHNIIKHRGHFLIDGNFEEANSFSTVFNVFQSALQNSVSDDIAIHNVDNFKSILCDNSLNNSTKASKLSKEFTLSEDKEIEKCQKKLVSEICKFIVGNKGDIIKLFGDDYGSLETTSFKLSDETFEDVILSSIEALDPDVAHFFETMKALHDWSKLSAILGTYTSISEAKVSQYNIHKENLKILRAYMKKYCKKGGKINVYNDFFNSVNGSANYSNYIGYVKTCGKKKNAKTASEDAFYDNLKKILESTTCDKKDEPVKENLLLQVQAHTLLPLLRDKNNAVVPKQIHEYELEKILENAAEYLPFLNEKDENGISVTEKIISIFNFRIPYFVGPLSTRYQSEGSNVWAVRKEDGRIYPWNIKNKIDYEKSNEVFIRRMTNKCTYLYGEDVIPRCSLLYSRYLVLNELNNIRVRGQKLSVSVKKEIFENVYLLNKKVTIKKICKYLQKYDEALTVEDIGGVAEDIKANMSAYIDFKDKVFGQHIVEDACIEMAENIIKWITIYGNDRRMIKEIVQKNYPGKFDDNQLKNICNLKYSGWANFSEKFLNEIKGANRETGECYTIIKALYETEDNLMQLLSSNYTFKEQIEAINAEKIGIISRLDYDKIFEDVNVSPSVKRPIWQSLLIADEIVKVMGHEPKKIFVEMARETESEDKKQKNKKNRNSRKQKLLDLYAACKDDTREWTKEIESYDERDFNSLKLYLYYTQMGKCMYTGKPIDLNELMSANSKWDRDHIYPQSRIKDDSLDNLVLVEKIENSKKSNGLLSENIRNSQITWWKQLLDEGFITKEKYYRLTRTADFTDEELAGFINRQLVETRQASKTVASLLDRMYQDSKIVYVKAGLTSDFRHKDLHVMKSRLLNDYHHAKDAYLNIVVGNVYNTKFTDNPILWMRKNRDTNYSLNAVFRYDVTDSNGKKVWSSPEKDENGRYVGGTMDTVRATVNSNRVLYTEYSYVEKNELFNATIQPKGEKSASVAIKKGLDIEKYGGYIGVKSAYFILIEFDEKKGNRARNIIGVPIYVGNMLKHNPNALMEYLLNKGYKNPTILYDKIKKNALLQVNGYPMRIHGDTGKQLLFKNGIQFRCDEKTAETVRLVEKFMEKERTDFVEKFDKLTEDDLLSIYQLFIEKLDNVYQKRQANQKRTLEEGFDKFKNLEMKDKIKLIYNAMNQFGCQTGTKSDLTLIGGAPGAGNIAITRNTLGKSKLVIINQSVTGLFENKVEL